MAGCVFPVFFLMLPLALLAFLANEFGSGIAYIVGIPYFCFLAWIAWKSDSHGPERPPSDLFDGGA